MPESTCRLLSQSPSAGRYQPHHNHRLPGVDADDIRDCCIFGSCDFRRLAWGDIPGRIPDCSYQRHVWFCIYYSIGAAMAIDISHAAGRSDNGRYAPLCLGRISYHARYYGNGVLSVPFRRRCDNGMFTEDRAVLSLAVTLLVPMALYQAGDATQITFANALRGTSHVLPMLYIAFSATL